MRSALLVLPLALAALLLAGCNQWTCEGACSQYYDADQCDQNSVRTDGTSQEQAKTSCIDDCTTALHNSASDRVDTNSLMGGNEDNAMEFISCVAQQDYSDEALNATCSELRQKCTWFNAW